MKMKIAVDGRDIGKNYLTGIGRFTLNLIKSMGMVDTELEFLFYFNQDSDAEINKTGMRKKNIHQGSTLIWDHVKLPADMKKEKIELFYSPYYKTSMFVKCPRIITVHDVINVNKSRLLKLKHRLFISLADKIATVSEYSKRRIIEEFKISGDKIHVIKQAIDDKFSPQDPGAIRDVVKKYKIADNYILYVGNFEKHKNAASLIDAYRMLPAGLKEKYGLVLVASIGSEYDSIRRSAENEPGITIINYIKDGDLPALYSGADLFVFPSLVEGFGLPPLEAMACGTAVLCSGIEPLIENMGEAAVYFNPDDNEEIKSKLKDVLSDEILRDKLAKDGMLRVKEFSHRNMAEDIIKLVKEYAK